jgi:uncharacterized protein (TIGR02145 family)
MEALISKNFLLSVKFSSLLVFMLVCAGCGGDEDQSPKNPKVEEKSVKDIAGSSYKTVVIGGQEWMAENLRTTKYNDGTDIPNVMDTTEWSNLNGDAYSWLLNDYDMYGTVYGALYNWYAINTGKLCPSGWHLPSDEEWKTLTDFLGGATVAGNKLKELGIIAWDNPFSGGTNETGFSALPGGFRNSTDGKFGGLKSYGCWWSSTESSENGAWGRYVTYNQASVFRAQYHKRTGFCVRCLKD